MSVEKIWVLAELSDGEPIATSLELISHARTLAGTVEAVTWGGVGDAVAGTLGAYGVTTVHDVGDLDGSLPGSPVGAAIAAAVEGGSGPDAILFPATYDGRDIAGRLSAKLDRPVLTNVVGLEAVEGSLVSEHAIFGGTQVLSAKFTGDGPQIFVVRAKSFPAEISGGEPATVVTASPPDTGAANAAKIVARHLEERIGPKLDEADVVVSGGRGLGEKEEYALIEELAALLAPGRPDGQDGQADPVPGVWDLRRHPASGGDEELEKHRGHQQGPGRPHLLGG